MLTVKKLLAALEGLDLDAQDVIGIINGPRYNAAYAHQEVCTVAEVDAEQQLMLREEAAPALYICGYEQPRPWEGPQPTVAEDGTATLEFDPEDDPGSGLAGREV